MKARRKLIIASVLCLVFMIAEIVGEFGCTESGQLSSPGQGSYADNSVFCFVVVSVSTFLHFALIFLLFTLNSLN